MKFSPRGHIYREKVGMDMLVSGTFSAGSPRRMFFVFILLSTFVQPSAPFFFSNRDSGEVEDDSGGLVRPLGQLALGGGTKIVYNVLTFSYLDDYKPAIRRMAKTAVINVGSWVLSNIISSIWSIIGLLLQFLYWFIETNVFISWMIKWGIKSFILDQIIG